MAKITCPICRLDTPLKGGDVNTVLCNYALLAAANAYATKSAETSVCDVCEEEKAAHRCIECSELLCENCCRVHRKQKLSRDHHIQSLSEFQEKGVDRKLRPSYCPVHPSEKEMHELTLCCKTCDFQPICVICVVMTHTKPDHDYVPLADITSMQKEELGQVIPALEARTKVLDSAIGQIAIARQAVVARKSKAEADIRSNFNALHDLLRDREKEAVNLVAALAMEKQKVLGSQAEALGTIKSGVIGCTEHIQHTLDTCADSEILVSRPVLLQRSSALLQQECVLLPEATADLWVNTDTRAVHAAIGMFCDAFVPNASSEHSTAGGSGLDGAQKGEVSEFAVDLRDSEGEHACIANTGEPEAVMAVIAQIVAVEAVVVSATAVADADAEATAGAGAGAGAGAPPPPPPPRQLPAAPAIQLLPSDDGVGLRCSYTPTFEGTMRVSVKVLGQHVPGSPFQVEVVQMIDWATATVMVSTVAGVAGSQGHVDGKGAAAKFSSPSGVSCAADGSVWVADYNNHCIRRIAADGTVSTVAGVAGSKGHVDGKGGAAKFNSPSGVSCAADGSVWVGDYSNHCIRRIAA
jgi:hypothetical protein